MSIKNVIKALNDESRLKIVYVLSENKYCQVHLANIIDISQCNISRNLNTLEKCGVISYEKTNNKNRYFVSDDFKKNYNDIYQKILIEYKDSEFDKKYLAIVENDCEIFNS